MIAPGKRVDALTAGVFTADSGVANADFSAGSGDFTPWLAAACGKVDQTFTDQCVHARIQIGWKKVFGISRVNM